MTGPLAVAERGAWVAAVAVVAGGAAVGGAYRLAAPAVARLAPAVRERVLWAFAVSPWFLAALLICGCFLPSFADWAGVARDHCGEHSHHAHLCFHHPQAGGRTAVVAGLAGVFGLVGLVAAAAALRGAWRYARLVGGLAVLAERDEARGVLRVATRRPLALTLGIFSPQVFVSEGLEAALSAADYEAVLAHERGHETRRDGLRKLAFSALTAPILPGPRRALVADYALTCELRCDSYAARVVGEPAIVARALLAVTRLAREWEAPAPAPACRFETGRTTARVHGLLRPEWGGSGRAWMAAFGATAFAAVLAVGGASSWLHHAAETALAATF